jgi:hypothetical protein
MTLTSEPNSSDKLVLYSFSSPSRKISILLEELNIPYENKDIALFEGEHFQPWFKEISRKFHHMHIAYLQMDSIEYVLKHLGQ